LWVEQPPERRLVYNFYVFIPFSKDFPSPLRVFEHSQRYTEHFEKSFLETNSRLGYWLETGIAYYHKI